jgi:uncharacterized membrane protein
VSAGVTSDVAAATVWGLALTPFIEIAGAIPAGLALHLGALEAALWAVVGNAALVIVLIALMEPLEGLAWMRALQRRARLPPRGQQLLARFGLPFVALLGPLIGMFVVIPAARVLGFSGIRLGLAAIGGTALFSLVYAGLMAWLVRF